MALAVKQSRNILIFNRGGLQRLLVPSRGSGGHPAWVLLMFGVQAVPLPPGKGPGACKWGKNCGAEQRLVGCCVNEIWE